MTSEGRLFTAVCDTNAASPSLGDAAIYAFPLRINLVGYTGKDAHGGLNWYTAQFSSVGFNTSDINDIKLDDGNIGTDEQMVGWGDPMQIVSPNGDAEQVYLFFDPSMDPSGEGTKFYWGDADCNPVIVSFDAGDGVGIENGTTDDFVAYKVNNAGQVPNEEVSFAAHGGLNWSGNPFPASININAVTLDDGNIGTDEQMVGWGDPMQIVSPNGDAEQVYLFFDPSMDPSGEGTKFYWGDADCNPVDVTILPGAGFAIENGTIDDYVQYTIKIACPYSL